MTRRRGSVRAAAIRRAHEAKAQRDAEQLAREQEIEAVLADYFEAVDRAAVIRAEAQRRADKTLADAEAAASPAEAASREAVVRLRTLAGSHAEVAGLCGLTVAAVRAMLHDEMAQRTARSGPGPASPSSPPAGPPAPEGTTASGPELAAPHPGPPGPGPTSGNYVIADTACPA